MIIYPQTESMDVPQRAQTMQTGPDRNHVVAEEEPYSNHLNSCPSVCGHYVESECCWVSSEETSF